MATVLNYYTNPSRSKKAFPLKHTKFFLLSLPIKYIKRKTKPTRPFSLSLSLCFCLSVVLLSLWCRGRGPKSKRVAKSGGGGRESMDSRRLSRVLAVISLVCHVCTVRAGDIVHGDDTAPKKPGCANDFVLVNLVLLLLFS